jgi:two-component system NtrC family response regulator
MFVIEDVLVGETPAMRQLRAKVAQLAPTPLAVLIVGETGSGKELVAQSLHALSGRSGRLVAVNVAAIADTMFEDEFFGHARGAFTGAIADRAGLLTESHRGTLFLDEVTSLTSLAQPKLLRTLETHTFRPVGARAEQLSDFRTVSATNADLETLVARGAFRRDLRRRLAECVIAVPGLAARRPDVPILARLFLDRIMHRNRGQAGTIAPEAMRVLEDYDWPDNVRELRHAIECAAAMSGDGHVSRDCLLAALADRVVAPMRLADAEPIDLARRRLNDVLTASDWDTMRVARQLGVNRATVYRRMARLGLQRPTRPSHSRDAPANLQSGGANANGDDMASGA